MSESLPHLEGPFGSLDGDKGGDRRQALHLLQLHMTVPEKGSPWRSGQVDQGVMEWTTGGIKCT